MKECYRHHGTPSAAECVACQQPICGECLEDVAGHPMCQPCVAAAQARIAQQSAPWLTPGASSSTAASPAAAAPAASVATVGPSLEVVEETTATPHEGSPPGVLLRLGRGWLWGLCYGQWWTLMTVASGFIWGHGWPGVGAVILMAIWYGFFGSIAGIAIGATNVTIPAGSFIGVGVGVLVCLLEAAISQSARELINLPFYFFTGRFVGAGITWRVQQPSR